MKKNDFLFYIIKIKKKKMYIYQDWEEVKIGNGKNKKINNNNHNNTKKKEENEDDMPEKLKKYPLELIKSLQEARKMKNLTQVDLAKRMNLPATTIRDIENNTAPYNRGLIRRIFLNLNVDLKTLNFPE
jgi:ribosome-binding protein aMBF1 (putative translation factor)